MTIQPLSAALKSFRSSLPERARIYVAGGSGEPLAFANELRQTPDLAAGVTFVGVWIPGINETDWAALHSKTRAETIFVSRALRPSFDRRQTHHHPLGYSQATRWISSTPLDGGVVMVSPPDEAGMVSLGVSVDFSTFILEREDVPVLGLINHSMIAPLNGPKIPIDRFQWLSETDHPLVQVPDSRLPDAFTHIGENVASLCYPGDTLQFGLGSVQQAVLQALGAHNNLRIHGGMISTPLIPLLDTGVFQGDYGAITTGVAIGTDKLYDRAIQDDRILFAPVTHTHALSTLAEIKRFKAINSCIEIDLLGQANAEFIRGRQISGVGGLTDFLRGAALSEGGRAILALPSTAAQGSISRIVPRLPAGAITVTRTDIDTVVTEHGIAELRNKSIDERASALIEIADPAFREQLSTDWHELRNAL